MLNQKGWSCTFTEWCRFRGWKCLGDSSHTPDNKQSQYSKNFVHLLHLEYHLIWFSRLQPMCFWQDVVSSNMSHTEELTPDGFATSTSTGENAESSSEEDLDESCGPLNSKELRRAIGSRIMKFGLELLENLKAEPKQSNIIISPLSVSLALSHLALGMFLTCKTWPNDINLMHVTFTINEAIFLLHFS